MPTYVPHALLQFGGSFEGQEDEEWTCSIRFMGSEGAVGQAPQGGLLAAVLAAAQTALPAWFSNPQTGICEAATLTFAKANAIGSNGRYLNAPTEPVSFQNIRGGVVVTGDASLRYPHQVSLVHTLETSNPKAKGGRGRIYVPAPGFELRTDGTISPADAAGAAARTAALIRALRVTGFAGQGANPAILSDTLVGGQRAAMITDVSVDTRLDIQRRRAKSVVGAGRQRSGV